MTAYTFTLRTRERGQFIGQAVICLEARYASVQWTHRERTERRFATPAQWKALQLELDEKLPAAPLEDKSIVAQVLAGDEAWRYSIQYLSQEPLPEGGAPDQLIVALDQRLRMMHVL